MWSTSTSRSGIARLIWPFLRPQAGRLLLALLVGLLIAVIFLASWGSIAAALNSLASASVVDLHLRFSKKERDDGQQYVLSRWYTFGWGVFCIVVAMFVTGMGSLIVRGAIQRDFPIVQGVVFAMVIIVITVNLIADLLCAAVDPRIEQ